MPAKKLTSAEATVTEPKVRPCKCVASVNKRLAEMNVELDSSTTIDFDKGTSRELSPLLAVVWKNGKKPRNMRLPKIFCAYCPMCGKKKD